MIRSLVFLDFETTGMSAGNDAITDIGLVRTGPNGEREEWRQLVNPGRRIPFHITTLTGISDAMVADAPAFPEVAGELARRCAGALIVAHNATFDIGFMSAGLDRCGLTRRLPHVCSVRVARKLLPKLKSRSLDALATHFGLRFAGPRHRAFPDAEMLHRLWFALRDAAGAELFDKTVAALICDGPPGSAGVPPAMGPTPSPLPTRRVAPPDTPHGQDGRATSALPLPSSVSPTPWPYSGPVIMRSTRREGEWHIFHEWRHLGSVTDERCIPEILDTGRAAPFVHTTYRKIVTALATPGVEIRPV